MRKALAFACILFVTSFSAFSQVTWLVDTAFTTDVGYDGAPASCIFTGGEIYGWNFNQGADHWIADDFAVPSGETWTFDTVIIYGYQPDGPPTSTFTGAFLEIFSGAPPGAGGSVVWGDTVTNIMSSTGFTGIYRVAPSDITDTSRPIMYLKLYLSPAPSLSAGTYWLSYASLGTIPNGPASTPVVRPGRINAGGMARQDLSGVWSIMEDGITSVSMNKIIKGSAAVTAVANINPGPVTVLSQNTPNPFNSTTNISFYLQQAGYAKLFVYNTTGQLVAAPFEGNANAGEYHINFDATNLPAGVYYYQLNTEGGTDSKRMLLVPYSELH